MMAKSDLSSMAKRSARFVFSLCSDHLYFPIVISIIVVIIIISILITIVIIIIVVIMIILIIMIIMIIMTSTLARASLAASASAAMALCSCSGTRTSFTWSIFAKKFGAPEHPSVLSSLVKNVKNQDPQIKRLP